MSQNNIRTVVAAVAIAASAPMPPSVKSDSGYRTLNDIPTYQQSYKSGSFMVYYPLLKKQYVVTKDEDSRIEKTSLDMQNRFHAMKHSFNRYGKGIPTEKYGFFNLVANTLCKLDFNDIVSSYNEDDLSIDTVLRLSNGLTLSISSFIDENINSPMVFSIHRGNMLLVADQMPINDIVETIKSVIA